MGFILLAGCQENAQVEKEESMPDKVETNEEAKVVEERDDQTEESNEVEEIEESVEQTEEKREITYVVDEATWTLKRVSEADEQKKGVLLTIDDAPDQYALEMAKLLHELKVPAIFFVNAHFLDTDEEKEVLRNISDLGFEIGNHTMDHLNLRKLPEHEQALQITDLNDLITEITGEKPRFFRAPFGVNTEMSNNTAKSENLIVMNWTYGYDWEKDYLTKEAIAHIMVNTPLLRDGAILLMHDRKWTYEALEEIVKGLRNAGYEFIDPEEIRLEKE